MEPLIAELLGVFPQVTDRPYVLFGHSLGSRVGFELALQCQRRGLPVPACFIASGSRAPHLRKREPPLHDLPEAEFVARLRELAGTPEEVLSNGELIQLLLPLLRADFRIADLYCATPTRLNCPLVVLAGTEDETVTSGEVQAWEELAGGGCTIHWIAGGHFFVEHNRAWVLEKVTAVLTQVTELSRRRALFG
jgi:surfactin synthase thioesterase subunit